MNSQAVLLVTALCFLAATSVRAQHQQQIDASYLQQYYAQVAQAAGAQPAEATPIFEQASSADQPQHQYVSPQQAQQIRQKDAVAQQVGWSIWKKYAYRKGLIVLHRCEHNSNSSNSTWHHLCDNICSSHKPISSHSQDLNHTSNRLVRAI